MYKTKSFLSLIITLLSLSPVSLSAQKEGIATDLERLKSCSWTNGFEFVKYNSPEMAKEIWNITVSDKNTLAFIGGTLHEGGTCLFIRHDEQSLWVDKKEEYQLFPSGDEISFSPNNEIILFRDAANGTLHGILKPFASSDELKNLNDLTIRNLRRLGIAGTYKDKTGKKYVFSAEENKVEGLQDICQEYDFAIILDFPSPILLFSEKAYAVQRTPLGMDLIPARLLGEEGFYESIPDAPALSLERVIEPTDSRYSLLSKEYLTLTELIIYGGDPFDGLASTDSKIKIQHLLETLSIMRNEIFARHGYIFKSAKWNNYFKNKKWYKPIKKDVTSTFSDIEEVNIELIQQLENKFRKELEEI